MLVGGCVRDAALGVPAKDLDFEVYGISPTRLEEVLSAQFELDRVGKAFGVLKLRGLEVDMSVPRRESRAGLGHKGFELLSDPWMAFEDAAARRDFTMNAMGLDPLTGELLDPYGGLVDLQAKAPRGHF